MRHYIFYKIILATIPILGFTECGDNIQYYDMTGQRGEGVYFPENSAYINLSENEDSFSVAICRTETSGPLTVTINVNEDKNNVSGAFSVDKEVTFASGEETAYVKVDYDIYKLEYETIQKISLEIDTDVAWNYGTLQTQLNIVRPADWIELGTGYYTDYYWFYYGYAKKGFTSLNDYYFDYVTVWQRSDNPNFFRIENPYQGYLTSPYFQFQILQKGETFLNQTITRENIVAWTEAPYVFNCYGDTWLWFPGYLTEVYDEEQYWVYNFVETYQENGWPEVIRIAPLFWSGDPQDESTIGWDFSGWDEEYVDYYCSIYFPVPDGE